MLSLFLYRLLWRIAPPLLRRYLRRRARLAPAYALNWNERFGVAQAQAVQRPIWIHAVSVGETRAAQPVIAALQTRFPDAPLLLTQMTPTGRATAEALYPQAQCRYLPYDHPAYVAQFMREHQPLLGVIMETEIWPNLLHAADAAKIPMFLANARLSARSQRGYQKVVRLVAPALATLKATFAQTEADAQRLASIGAVNVQVSGNSKYDIEPPAPMHVLAGQFRQRIGARPVVVCASTRTDDTGQDEAALLLAAWRAYAGDALLVLVPRHPERFQAAFTQAQSLGYRVQKRSDEQAVHADTQVWIGDSMGELFAYYLAADIAFVGGSLVDTGCQNIIEPMACGLPTLFGYSTFNFAQACADAVAAGAACQVTSADKWYQTVSAWLAQPALCQPYRQQARAFVAQHQGASERMALAMAAAVAEQAA